MHRCGGIKMFALITHDVYLRSGFRCKTRGHDLHGRETTENWSKLSIVHILCVVITPILLMFMKVLYKPWAYCTTSVACKFYLL